MLPKKIVSYLKQIRKIPQEIHNIQNTLNSVKESLGRIEARQLNNYNSSNINDYEFKVYSQWGEDGIIQFLLQHINIKQKIFIEFGVENYSEANTRFLLINNNWSGLVIDSDQDNINYIKKDPIYWRYNLKAVKEFITKKNINNIIQDNGIKGEIGLLSIDIDGNDYWIWETIDVITPAIVIIEYNFRFDKHQALTIPYQDKFSRSQAHHSMIYYGASLKSLYILAQKKGYSFVGCNSSGNNAFFIRKDLKLDCIKEVTVNEGYISGKFRESRNNKGQLTYLSVIEEKEIIKSLPLVEIE